MSYIDWLLAGPYGYENWTLAFDWFVGLGFLSIGAYCWRKMVTSRRS